MHSAFYSLTRASLFTFITISKITVNIGQVCLTMNSTFIALCCLSNCHLIEKNNANTQQKANLALQATAATFSTLLLILTRCPAIWNKLDFSHLKNKFRKLNQLSDFFTLKLKCILFLTGLLGLISCLARGLSAYLSVEVILGQLDKKQAISVFPIGFIAGFTTTLCSICFNWSNMLENATYYWTHPKPSIQPSTIVSVIAAISEAVAKRFFIMHFLNRRKASATVQILFQSLVAGAEFIFGLFTMVSSFKPQWKKKAILTLKNSFILTFIILGDGMTAWLGYHTITWYSIFTDVFVNQNKTTAAETLPLPTETVFPQNSFNITDSCEIGIKTTDTDLGWILMSGACLMGLPATLAYLHYLLSYAKTGYDKILSLSQTAWKRCHYGFLKAPDEQKLVLQESKQENTDVTHPVFRY